jgi:flagellar L-ring protein precursor FlgH
VQHSFLKSPSGYKNIIFILFLTMTEIAYAGGLYSEDQYVSLVGDHRSNRVGEILTVLIYETASASTKMETDTNKGTNLSASASDGTNTVGGRVGVNSGFEGGGTSSQTGKLVASVSVEITEIMANGDMRVAGEQLLEFNNDIQHISVKGLVRKKDVSSNNTVLSTRLASAQIQFSGEGLLTNRSKPGIFTQMWNWLF